MASRRPAALIGRRRYLFVGFACRNARCGFSSLTTKTTLMAVLGDPSSSLASTSRAGMSGGSTSQKMPSNGRPIATLSSASRAVPKTTISCSPGKVFSRMSAVIGSDSITLILIRLRAYLLPCSLREKSGLPVSG